MVCLSHRKDGTNVAKIAHRGVLNWLVFIDCASLFDVLLGRHISIALIVKVDGEKHSHKVNSVNGLGGQNDISHSALYVHTDS